MAKLFIFTILITLGASALETRFRKEFLYLFISAIAIYSGFFLGCCFNKPLIKLIDDLSLQKSHLKEEIGPKSEVRDVLSDRVKSIENYMKSIKK